MSAHHCSRRDVRSGALGAVSLAVAGGVAPAVAQGLKRTPSEILGPFYPVMRTVEVTADLTTMPVKPGRAAGQVVHLMGRVRRCSRRRRTSSRSR